VILNPHACQSEDDFWRIRSFLRQVFLLNGRRMLCWPVARLDYWRWHGIMNLGDGSLETGVYLWETRDGELVAVLNQEEYNHAFLQIHPVYKTAKLEEQMIALAEEKLPVPRQRGGKVLWVWCDSTDNLRQGILQKRGFAHKPEWDEHEWYRNLELPIPDVQVKEGYIIRSLGDNSELPSRSWASWRAFHPDQPDENYSGDHAWYLNIQHAPLYRRNLDLVAIAPSGEVAAFTTIWYDDVTRGGLFEPVGTVPEHQRRGLARALMYEGMRRLKMMGADRVMVSGGSIPANALYQSVMGPDYDVFQAWEKRWPAVEIKPGNT